MKNPNAFKWSLKFGLISALTGMICCVAPAILFMFGLMGGVVAISFADFFYAEDGSIGTGSILLRIIACCLGIYGFIMFRKKQDQCSIDPKRKRLNLTLLTFLPSCGNATLETTAAKKVAQLKTATTPTSRGTAIGSISVTVEGLRCANIAQMATTTAKY